MYKVYPKLYIINQPGGFMVRRIIEETGPEDDTVVYRDVNRPAYTYRYSNPAVSLIWTIAGIITALLGIRFLLNFFGANPNSGFTQFINGVTQPLIAPFDNIFPAASVQNGFLEWSTLLAIVFYLIIASILASLLSAGTRAVMR